MKYRENEKVIMTRESYDELMEENKGKNEQVLELSNRLNTTKEALKDETDKHTNTKMKFVEYFFKQNKYLLDVKGTTEFLKYNIDELKKGAANVGVDLSILDYYITEYLETKQKDNE